LSAAGWLAASGASLLLVASIIVVAGNWRSIDPAIRFSGLVSTLLAVYFAAEAGRRRFPTTSTSLATLAACLTAPVGVAAAATVGQPWTVCTLVGGLAALVATEVQSRRWDVAPLKAATVVSFGLATVGLAALTTVPAPVIGAVGAVAALLLGSTRRTLSLAVAVGTSPLFVTLADTGIGTGTLARIGATGDVLAWSAPASCAVAAGVVAVLAHRGQNASLAAVSVAVLGSGVMTGLVGADVGAAAWFCLPAIAVLATEAVAASRPDSMWRRLARTTTVPLGVGLAAAALASPLVALVARWDASANAVAADGWYVPLALWSVALVAATVGSARRLGGVWSTVAPLAASVAAMSTLALAGAPMWSVPVAALLGWMAVTAVTPWSTWDVTTATLATWVALASLVDDVSSTFWFAALLVAGTITVVSCSVVGRADAGVRSIVAAAITAFAAASALEQTGTPGTVALQFGTLVFVALVGVGATIRPERSIWPLSIAGYASLRAVDGRRSHVAAGIATVAGGLALAAAGVDAGTAAVAASLVGIGYSGLAALDRRLVIGQTAGVVASGIAVVASVAASPIFTSIALVVLGAQIIAAGLTTGRRPLLPAGVATTVGSTISLWWTTGTNQWVIDEIAPYGADGGDVAMAAASAALLAGGFLLRRRQAVSTWLAYSPGLGMAGTWLVATQLEPGTDWATFAALLVGVIALAIGGIRRLGAPLVLGSLLVVSTIAVSAGSRLAAAPTWVWIAGGGTGLLVIAALLERSERPLLPVGRRGDQQRSLLEQFCEEFQ
jgi:hypothetical protein